MVRKQPIVDLIAAARVSDLTVCQKAALFSAMNIYVDKCLEYIAPGDAYGREKLTMCAHNFSVGLGFHHLDSPKERDHFDDALANITALFG